MTIIISFTSAVLTSLVLAFHPIHVSVTEIEFDEKDRRLEIMMRIFIDDLNDAIKNSKKIESLDILEPGTGLTTDQLVGEYVLKHFAIKVDNKLQKTSYLGSEKEDNALICYIEVSNIKKMKTIEVTNDIITELYDDQSNLVHVTVRGKVKSLRLMKSTPSDKLTFEAK
ncbi:MAG: hypothetical protein L0Y35_06700 [Flammeovirgaceae bacterium]|nr:hypothetical protein [Flammeovirgaceae bacterium]